MTNHKVTDDLEHLLKTAADHDQLDVNIFLRGEPADLVPRAKMASTDSMSAEADTRDIDEIVDQMKTAAGAAQTGVLAFLGERAGHTAFTDDGASVTAATSPEAFWITNAVGTRVTARTLARILEREDVEFVDLSRHVPIDELTDAKKKPEPNKSRGDRAKVAWSVQHINAPLCWQLGLTGKSVLVAIVDTGVNYNHPDLKKRMWKGGKKYPKHGYDFENNNNNPFDNNGHGTATAGQVAGDGTCGRKTGVAPEATILAIRVGGVERNFWSGLQFALTQKAKVISMSMTWKYPSSPNYPGWRRVCQTILAARILHANSIGNQGTDLIAYPLPFNIATPGNCPPPWRHQLQGSKGGHSSPISVGATDSADRLAASSGRGPAAWNTAPYNDYPYTAGNATRFGLLKPDVCAPGRGTLSCNYLYPAQPGANPYRSFGGTSAATPHVAGCLAILVQACLAAKKPIIPARVQEAVEQTAKRVQGQTASKENHYGSGRIDVYAAYQYGKKMGWW